jgi:hypothetical protein
VFLVSVASKELSLDVSLLFATLAGRSISVAGQGLREEEVRRGDEVRRGLRGGGRLRAPRRSGSSIES